MIHAIGRMSIFSINTARLAHVQRLHRINGLQSLNRPFSFTSESHFHSKADAALQSIHDRIGALEDEYEIEVSMSQGVLKIETPNSGTWVLNKQAPNQQIWWSSPKSGPLRFEYKEGAWVTSRTGRQLEELLKSEIVELLGNGVLL